MDQGKPEGTLMCRLAVELEPCNTCRDQCDRYQPEGAGAFAEQRHAQDSRADYPDAGPDRIGGPNRQGSNRLRQEPETAQHRSDGDSSGQWAREAAGVLESDRPGNL